MPTTLSAEQFKQKYGNEGINKFNVTLSAAEFQKMKSAQQGMDTSQQPNQDFFSGLGQDLSKRSDNIIQGVKQSVGLAKEAVQARNQQPAIETTGQVMGAVAGAVITPILQSIGGLFDVVKHATPDAVKKPIIDSLKAGFNALADHGPQYVKPNEVKYVMDKYNEAVQHDPSIARDLEASKNLLAAVFLSKDVVEGAQGLGSLGADVKNGIAQNTGKILTKVGSTVEKTGNVVESTAKVVSDNAFTPGIQEAERLQAFKAANPLKERVKSFFSGEILPGTPRTTGATALEKGIAGTESSMGVQAASKAKSLWKDTIQPAVQSVEERLSKTDIFNDIQKGIDKVKDITTKKSFQEGFDAVKQDYKNVKDFSYEDAQQIKSELDKKVPIKMFRGKEVTGSANNIRKLMADSIRNRTYQVLKDVNIKKDYLDYGNLKNIMEHGAKSMTKGQFKGGAGSFVHAAYDMAVTPIKTVGSQVLYKSANGLRFVGSKGFTKFGQYLESFVK